MKWARLPSLLAVAVLVAAAAASAGPSRGIAAGRPSPTRSSASAAGSGIHKIKHVIILMQENRSFDSYFGTYPGADGIPGLAGNPGTVPCLPDPREACVQPFHDAYDVNFGGPHNISDSALDID